METEKNADLKKEERSQIVDLGSDMTRSEKGNIYTLTIIGQIEGHQVAPETVKTTNMSMSCPCLPESRRATMWMGCCFCSIR